ncbi:MAG: YigZ family protein, partial [Methylophilales bacterium 28-44-11]
MITLKQPASADQTIQKSRFIAQAKSCETEREVSLFLRQMASQHPTAHHLAYAYRIKTMDGVIPRFSDAGEPSGTAGKPILQILDGQQYINVCVGVIRYYGGINLGTGGLVKAYGGTAKLALDHAGIMPFIEMQEMKITISYKRVDELTRELAKLKGTVLNKDFDDAAHFIV